MLTHNSLTVKTHDTHVHSKQKKICSYFSVRFISFTLLAPCKLYKDNAKHCFVIYPLFLTFTLHKSYKLTILRVSLQPDNWVSSALVSTGLITLLLFFMIPLSLRHETSLNLGMFTSFEPYLWYLSINVKIEHLRNSCLWENSWLLLTIYWPCMSCRHGETSPRLSPFEKKW